MADSKQYYYMRLKEDFFDSEEMKLLESLPDGYLYSNILLKLYLISLKRGGRLMFNNRIPYNAQMLSTLTRHQVGTVERALTILEDFGFIERLETGVMYMLDIQTLVGKSSTEADRKREYRAQIAAERQQALPEPEPLDNQGQDNGGTNVPQMSDERVREYRDKRLEIRVQSIEGGIEEPAAAPPPPAPPPEKQKKKINYQQIMDLYNSVCTALPSITTMSEDRKEAIRARLSTYSVEDLQRAFEKAQASEFLRGRNPRNWRATFDWLIKDANLAKVLDGNYDDKPLPGAPGRKEMVPEWMDKPKASPLAMAAVQRMLAEEESTPDPALAARVEALRERIKTG